jgi:hypothetical protein
MLSMKNYIHDTIFWKDKLVKKAQDGSSYLKAMAL